MRCARSSLRSEVEIARDIVEQPVAEGCTNLLSRLLELRRTSNEERGVCLISGGEFACPVRGRGVGGRNAESALRWAIESAALAEQGSIPSRAVALSAGTDGIDGNSPAAGAIIDETTMKRARSMNLDARLFLDESDAYTFSTLWAIASSQARRGQTFGTCESCSRANRFCFRVPKH